MRFSTSSKLYKASAASQITSQDALREDAIAPPEPFRSRDCLGGTPVVSEVSPLASAPTTRALGVVQSASKCDKLAPPSAAYMRTPCTRMRSCAKERRTSGGGVGGR